MSIKDWYNNKIIIEKEHCNNFVTLYKEIKDITKMLKKKEIVNIEYNLKIEYR